jgi:hypothetical protein
MNTPTQRPECPRCNGEGGREALVVASGSGPQTKWRRGWRACDLCGGTGHVAPEDAANELRIRAQRDSQQREAAEAHYLPRLATDTFAWLVDEGPYELIRRHALGAGGVDLRYKSDRTCVRIFISLPRDPEFSISLAPAGGTFCSMNSCLKAHGIATADLSMPYSAPRTAVESTLATASAALRALTGWEVGGNWSTV